MHITLNIIKFNPSEAKRVRNFSFHLNNITRGQHKQFQDNSKLVCPEFSVSPNRSLRFTMGTK